jgi:hypothetical protein
MLELIENIESKWLKELYNYNYNLFLNKHIPSHDHSHHFRVWLNVKNLAIALHTIQDSTITAEKLECLIIAAFFHDTGITKTLDEKHGKAGKEICFEFLHKTKIDIPPGINEALTAIEFHENKEHENILKNKTSILAILSAADDMDAFGAIGIYRYAEIYLMRNIKYELFAKRILANLEKRYSRMENAYRHLISFMIEVHNKYLITHNFFKDLILSPLNTQTEPAKFIEIIKKEIIQNRRNQEEVWHEYLELSKNDEFMFKLLSQIIEENNKLPQYAHK